MNLSNLSGSAQQGLRLWAMQALDGDTIFDVNGSDPCFWKAICVQLRAAKDDPAWFPKGKWATIQVIESFLYAEPEI